MRESLTSYDKFLSAKLYLIEHKISDVLHSKAMKQDYKKTLEEVRNICYASYNEVIDRFSMVEKQ
jgi:hypothetical protein